MENNKGTICVQGGWQPKRENQEFYLFIRVQHLSMIHQTRWEDYSI